MACIKSDKQKILEGMHPAQLNDDFRIQMRKNYEVYGSAMNTLSDIIGGRQLKDCHPVTFEKLDSE